MTGRSAEVVRSILAINERDLPATWIGDEETTWMDVATGEIVQGSEAWFEYLREWYRGFPDGRVEILNVIEGASEVVVEFTGQGTHAGSYYGMAATGRSCLDRLCNIYEFNGTRLQVVRSYWDQMSMLAQLGLVERPTRKLNEGGAA
jgi:predicted ester cyclase